MDNKENFAPASGEEGKSENSIEAKEFATIEEFVKERIIPKDFGPKLFTTLSIRDTVHGENALIKLVNGEQTKEGIAGIIRSAHSLASNRSLEVKSEGSEEFAALMVTVWFS